MFGNGSGSSAIVTEQSALIAKGGGLTATVAGNTDLKGGVIAALDAGGKDSGKLTLVTESICSRRTRHLTIATTRSLKMLFVQHWKQKPRVDQR